MEGQKMKTPKPKKEWRPKMERTKNQLRKAVKHYGIDVRMRAGQWQAYMHSGQEKCWQWIGGNVTEAANSLAGRLLTPETKDEFWSRSGL
jgi:hypothetical protein